MTTKNEKEHLRKLAEFGCALCYKLGYEGTPAEIHHIRRGNIPRSTAPVIPLCPEHHRGNSSIHGLGRKLFERTFKTTEEELLEMVSAKFPPPVL
jgi:hypothetical protein